MNKLKSGARFSLSVKRTDHIPKTGNVMTVILHVQDNNESILVHISWISIESKDKNWYQLEIIMHPYILFDDVIGNDINLSW